MTAKARDQCKRWRNVTVAFRMSPEENEHLNHLVQLSGMTKQDYIIARLLQKEIVVHGNPRVYKALKERMDAVLKELKRLNTSGQPSPEMLEEIELILSCSSGFLVNELNVCFITAELALHYRRLGAGPPKAKCKK